MPKVHGVARFIMHKYEYRKKFAKHVIAFAIKQIEPYRRGTCVIFGKITHRKSFRICK